MSNEDQQANQAIVSGVQPLEDLQAPTLGEFFTGVGIGLTIVGIGAAVALT